MNHEALLRLWAKLGSGTDAYPDLAHPVICHLIDVQCVARELWDRAVGKGFQHWVADAIGLPTDEASRWVSLWVGAHDLGKISPDFQMKAAKRNAALIPALEAQGFGQEIGSHSSSIPHGQITAITLPEILTDQLGTPRSLARVISQATGGHHGRFVSGPVQSDLDRRLRSGSSQIGTGRWNQARREAIHILAANAGLERRNSWLIGQRQFIDLSR